MWKQSVRLYQEEYVRAGRFKADYLVTHVGSHRGQGEVLGIRRVAEALTKTLKDAPSSVMILLENTAGSGQGIGYSFEHLAAIRSQVGAASRVGICLDTAHLFAAGFPIHTADGLDEVLAAFDRIVGLEHLKFIHLNDSKVPFDSRVDRHWHIGKGHIGSPAFGRIINHPQLRERPFVLETPKETARPGHNDCGRAGEDADRQNLSTVRRLRSASARQSRVAKVSRHGR